MTRFLTKVTYKAFYVGQFQKQGQKEDKTRHKQITFMTFQILAEEKILIVVLRITALRDLVSGCHLFASIQNRTVPLILKLTGGNGFKIISIALPASVSFT
jgi:hypothetical protein